MDALEQKAIDLFAVYATPSVIFKEMRREFGENSLSLAQIRKVREKYRKNILEKRQNLEAEIPILNPIDRWQYLQDILDGALEGETLYSKEGVELGRKPERQIALKALELAHNLTQPKGAVNDDDDDLIRSIVMDAFKDLKSAKPTKTDKELLDEMLETLPPNAKPFIYEIETEYVRRQADSQ